MSDIYRWDTPPGYGVSMHPGGYWAVYDKNGGAVFWSRDHEEINEFLKELAAGND